MVQRVVYNSCFGGFGLKEEAVKWVRENKERLKDEYQELFVEQLASATLSGELFPDGSGPKAEHHTYINDFHLTRDNRLLADIVSRETEYAGPVDPPHANLRVAEVPDGVDWRISEYDGNETVEEQTQTFS